MYGNGAMSSGWPLLWCTLPYHSIPWKAYLCPQDYGGYLNGAKAVTISDKASIYIDVSITPEQRIWWLGHELIHVIFSISNAEHSSGLFRCDEAMVPVVEEALASFAGPAFVGILYGAGLLKFPNLKRVK